MTSPTYTPMDLNAFGPMNGSAEHPPSQQTDHSYLLSALNSPGPSNTVKPKPSALTAVSNGIGPIPLDEPRESEADRAGYLFGRQYNELGVMDGHQHDHRVDDTQNALDELFGDGTTANEGTNENRDIHIDPTLSAPMEIVVDANPALNFDSSTLPQTPDSPPTSNKPTKRKASSRANMIARGAACEFCKRRKLKCSAEDTGCMACMRAGKECVYLQKKQRSRVRVLEDRLMDLEKRLGVQGEGGEGGSGSRGGGIGGNGGNGAGGDGTGMYISPATTLDDTPGVAEGQWDVLGGIQAKTTDIGFTLEGLAEGISGGQTREDIGLTEPDLMTLADAAANNQSGHSLGQNGDRSVIQDWAKLSAEDIAREIVRAVEGGKGIGEKVILHLLPFYANHDLSSLHRVISPITLFTRFSATTDSPSPHPALLLSILPKLLQHSPSPSLSSPSRIETISTHLRSATHLFIQKAITTADPRALDILSANTVLAITAIEESQFLDSWYTIGGLAAAAWSTGLGKLGGVSQRFLGGDAGWNERVKREERLRDVRRRTVLVEPPRDMKELGGRISLFWSVYICTTIACIGWNCPTTIVEEEITTPFPKDDYESTENAKDMRTINDFLAGNANTGVEDSNPARQVKALCLLYRVTRFFDMSPAIYKPEKTSATLKLIKSYLASLPRVMITSSTSEEISPLCQVYQMLYAAMMLCHLREEIDASPNDLSELTNKAIEAGEKVVAYLDMSHQAGDSNLDAYDTLGCAVWGLVGRTGYRIANKLQRSKTDRAKAAGYVERLRGIGARLTEACHTLGKRIKYAEVQAQLLENYSVGAEAKLGECERVDYVA